MDLWEEAALRVDLYLGKVGKKGKKKGVTRFSLIQLEIKRLKAERRPVVAPALPTPYEEKSLATIRKALARAERHRLRHATPTPASDDFVPAVRHQPPRQPHKICD